MKYRILKKINGKGVVFEYAVMIGEQSFTLFGSDLSTVKLDKEPERLMDQARKLVSVFTDDETAKTAEFEIIDTLVL